MKVRMKKGILMCLGWFLLIGCLVLCYRLAGTTGNHGEGDVHVIVMKTTEDADCTLLYQDGAAVMIDTGTKEDAAHILEVMAQNGVTKLDYLILSHGDQDHIGGAAEIIEQIPVGFVVESGHERAREEIQVLNAGLKELGIPVVFPAHTQRFQAGEIKLLVYPPLEKHYNDSNNGSLAVLVQHEQVNMLFAGDALRKRSEELMLIDWPEIDLYKVAHHGRGNTATGKLFDLLAPKYGVVTAKAADQDVLDGAKRNQTEMFYTGNGDCLFVSDGKALTVQ